MLRAESGSIGVPWSGPMSETSEMLVPSSSRRTRLESIPRMIGREAPDAKPEAETPGTVCNASAMLAPPAWRIWSASTLAGIEGVSSCVWRKGVAVTMIAGSVVPLACAEASSARAGEVPSSTDSIEPPARRNG